MLARNIQIVTFLYPLLCADHIGRGESKQPSELREGGTSWGHGKGPQLHSALQKYPTRELQGCSY